MPIFIFILLKKDPAHFVPGLNYLKAIKNYLTTLTLTV